MVTQSIFDLIARSPLKPLQQHMRRCHECAQLLLPFFKSCMNDEWTAAETTQQRITELEHQADLLKADLRLHLPKNLFLPVSRSDILELLSAQDEIANITKDIAGLMVGRKMRIPTSISTQFSNYLEVALKAASQGYFVINELDDLLETGFKGREVQHVTEMIKTLNAIEHDSDEQQIVVRRAVFALEQELPPIDVMFLYQVIEYVGQLADCAQRAGGRLQLMLAS